MDEAGATRQLVPERLRGYFAATALVLTAVGIGFVLRRLPHANLSLMFLLAVLIVAAVWGLWPSIYASVMSFLALNFLFTTPVYSFTVEEEGDLASIVFFLAMAALTANLASRMRTEMADSQVALGRLSTLLAFSRRMSSAVSADAVLSALTRSLSTMTGASSAAWLASAEQDPKLEAETQVGGRSFPDAEVAEIWASGTEHPQTRGPHLYLPLSVAGERVGLVAIDGAPHDAERRQVTDGLCEQAVLALERTMLVEDLKQAQLVSQTEQLRSALLSSVSHDLKTPLASIIGSVSSVLEYRELLKPEDQEELLQTVLQESHRLNRYIQNLLDMTRFGQERIEIQREWVDLNDVAAAAIERLGAAAGIEPEVRVAREVALIFVHGALIEQALVNIIGNAMDFSDAAGAIRIDAFLEGAATVIDVVDEGPGIAPEERERVFEMFYRAVEGDERRHGVGLGLAICRSIVEAHGGTIEALPGDNDRGTRIRIRLPVGENPIGTGDA